MSFLVQGRAKGQESEASCSQTSKVCLLMVDKPLCQKGQKSKGEDSNLGEEENQVKVPVLAIFICSR